MLLSVVIFLISLLLLLSKTFMTIKKDQKKKKHIEYEEFVICPECGREQADMGVNVKCEDCGALMPTAVKKE